MLDLARKTKPRAFLYFSSSEIYGNPHPEHIPTKETYHGHVSSTGLRACYDESKRMGETLCTVYHRTYGVPVAIVRPFNVYGPGMKANDYRVLPNFLTAALYGRTIEIHNNGMQTRTFCYATDAMDGFFRVLLLGKSGEAYNIGSDDDEITMHELAKRTENVFGKKLKIKEAKYPEGYPVGDPERRRPDLTKARTHLEYAPSVSLEEGLGKMFIWYRKLLELE
jgi:UDP-glucuronate decarboxylase